MDVPLTEVFVRKDDQIVYHGELAPGDYIIGRDCSAEISLPDLAYLSRKHAKLEINFHDVFLEDLGSANGSFVQDKRIEEPTRLWPGQRIRVGSATVEVRRQRRPFDPRRSFAPETERLHKLLPEDIRGERKYLIGNLIGEGGMGVVLEATELPLNRQVAMKVLVQTAPDLVTRFIEEAQIAGQLEHPCIVPIYELSVNEFDQPFYTMKLIRGSTLQGVLDEIPLGSGPAPRLDWLLEVFQKVCDGIAYAHAKGVIHRDLKPENVMLGEFNEVLITDWGLAKALGLPAQPGLIRSVRQGRDGEALTVEGAILGTPYFMSPEQARGDVRNLDARTDIYGLGAILYQILTLEKPVHGDDHEEILDNVRAGNVVQPRERIQGRALPHLPAGGIPEPLAAVCMKALSSDPLLRYSRVHSLLEDLGRAKSGQAGQLWSALGEWIGRRKEK